VKTYHLPYLLSTEMPVLSPKENNTQIKEIVIFWCGKSIDSRHSNHVKIVCCNSYTLLPGSEIGKMNVKKEYIYIFVYIRLDLNSISVLAIGLKYSCSACHITEITGD
jgi:hypothetical protein